LLEIISGYVVVKEKMKFIPEKTSLIEQQKFLAQKIAGQKSFLVQKFYLGLNVSYFFKMLRG